ncbi:retrovirus-related Pol polyprotein from transposon TNT 1-94 [Trichonephila clavipes]|nr:retrovirus-related Pol polyprotein from transposon TNT 1-94 [Trichonephila clavipes]
MDLCGPMPTESRGGNKYFLSIIYYYSRKVTVFPIRNKSDVFHTFIRFQKRAERFLSTKVIAVRTDAGLEFCNKDMDNFLTELGIKHEVTNSYTPEMNGVAERFNLTALDGIKTLLKSSEVPHKFWGEALLCFTYAWNRICHKDSNKTPFEKYSDTVIYMKQPTGYEIDNNKVYSDFATNRDDRVSMGGFITFIDETPISWRTFKQKSVSLSTMEAEYVSLTEAAKEFIWLKNIRYPRITTGYDYELFALSLMEAFRLQSGLVQFLVFTVWTSKIFSS